MQDRIRLVLRADPRCIRYGPITRFGLWRDLATCSFMSTFRLTRILFFVFRLGYCEKYPRTFPPFKTKSLGPGGEFRDTITYVCMSILAGYLYSHDNSQEWQYDIMGLVSRPKRLLETVIISGIRGNTQRSMLGKYPCQSRPKCFWATCTVPGNP